MSRGRRGGRRQRRREEQARQAQQENGTKQTNGQSGPAAAVIPPAQTPPPVEPPHPRPMSARELVARLEKLRAQEAHAAQEATDEPGTSDPVEAHPVAVPTFGPAPAREPRRFRARGGDWIATHAGRGAGGTGRIAHARLEAIHFASAAEPERIVAEVLAPHARLDDLYEDELVSLLEQGLRYRKEDG